MFNLDVTGVLLIYSSKVLDVYQLFLSSATCTCLLRLSKQHMACLLNLGMSERHDVHTND